MMTKKINKVVIHIGPDKTGSTAIQQSFNENSSFFNSHGVYYSTNYSHNDKGLFLWFCADAEMASVIVNTSDTTHLNIIKEYQKAFQKRHEQLQSGATWVFSHEGLIYLPENDLATLKQFMLKFALEVQIVFYVRDPLSYAISAKSQRIKTGQLKSWKKPNYIEFANILPRFVQVFGLENIEARLFDKEAFIYGDVFLDFINAKWAEGKFSGIQKVLPTSFQPNLSLDANAYLLLKSLAEILKETSISRKDFRNQFAGYWSHNGPALRLSPIEALLVLFQSRTHFAYVKQTFGVEPKIRFARYTGFSTCKHLASEIRAQAIVYNEHFPEKPGISQRFLWLAGALFRDVLLLPVCFTRKILKTNS